MKRLKKAGASLIEVMFAVAIASTLLLILYQVMLFTNKGIEVLKSSNQALLRALFVEYSIRKDLKKIKPVGKTVQELYQMISKKENAYEDVAALFISTPHDQIGCTFLSALKESHVSYIFKPSEDGFFSLIRSESNKKTDKTYCIAPYVQNIVCTWYIAKIENNKKMPQALIDWCALPVYDEVSTWKLPPQDAFYKRPIMPYALKLSFDVYDDKKHAAPVEIVHYFPCAEYFLYQWMLKKQPEQDIKEQTKQVNKEAQVTKEAQEESEKKPEIAVPDDVEYVMVVEDE